VLYAMATPERMIAFAATNFSTVKAMGNRGKTA